METLVDIIMALIFEQGIEAFLKWAGTNFFYHNMKKEGVDLHWKYSWDYLCFLLLIIFLDFRFDGFINFLLFFLDVVIISHASRRNKF